MQTSIVKRAWRASIVGGDRNCLMCRMTRRRTASKCDLRSLKVWLISPHITRPWRGTRHST